MKLGKQIQVFIKMAARARSLRIGAEFAGWLQRPGVRSFRWRGLKLFYEGTPGAGEAQHILFRSRGQYWLPKALNPQVILDIGANTGFASAYMRWRFPAAKIIAVEPLSILQPVLRKNAESLGNMEVYPVALGARNGQATIRGCRNFLIGSSCHVLDPKGTKFDFEEPVTLRTLDTLLDEAHVSKVDLIKIDREGAEYDVLANFGKQRLCHVSWILGELHGNKDYETLGHLASFFEIDCRKQLNRRFMKFHAVRKDVVTAMGGNIRPRWLQAR